MANFKGILWLEVFTTDAIMGRPGQPCQRPGWPQHLFSFPVNNNEMAYLPMYIYAPPLPISQPFLGIRKIFSCHIGLNESGLF